MIKQVEFIKDVVEYWIADKCAAQNGSFYVVASPCLMKENESPMVRVKVLFYRHDYNDCVLVFDLPLTGLQFKWMRDWCAESFPQLSKQMGKRFDEVFEIIGRQCVMRRSWFDKNERYYGKYKGYKL